MNEQDNFPSGLWIGFYTYGGQGGKHRMDLGLTFVKGSITGEGNDDVGAFVLRGQYDARTMECYWTKTYVAAHDVFYKGFREGKGIYGRWEIDTVYHGGFHIWPLAFGEDDGGHETKEQVQPVEAVGEIITMRRTP